MTQIAYTAPPTLSKFMESNAFVRGCIGPVGSGKSSASIMEILRRACEQTPSFGDGKRRTRWAIVRNTYPQLRDTTRKTFEQWIPPALGKWREQEFTFEMRFKDVEADILFRALDRPEDVKKLLSLELTGAYINEAREVPKSVFDVLQTRVGRYPSKVQAPGGASWFGIWFDSNPWHSGHWGYKLFRLNPEGHDLFRQPGGRAANAENVENLPTGYYQRLCVGKDSEWIRVYVDGEDAISDEGAIWAVQVDQLQRAGGILEFNHPNDGVYTTFDLGFTDATGIWFWRLNEHRRPDVIDHYESHGKPLSHFFEVIDRKGYAYAKHWLPHDAKARTLVTGTSVLEQFIEKYGAGMVGIVPKLSLVDGIQAGRWLLEQPMRFHTRCGPGLEALREYRYEWDELDRAFSKHPLHNWASHTADAFRYLALVVKTTEVLTRPEPKPDPIAAPVYRLDDLWEDYEDSRRRGIKRI